jgi:O-antigen ligase
MRLAQRIESLHPGLMSPLAAIRACGRLVVALLVSLPVWAFLTGGCSLSARLIVAGLLTTAFLNPRYGLLILAGLGPLAGPIGDLVDPNCSLPEPVVLAFLAGWLLRRTIERGPRAGDRTRAILTPALLFGVAVAASAISQMRLPGDVAILSRSAIERVLGYLGHNYHSDPNALGGLVNGALLLEGVGLFVAAVAMIRREPALGRQVAAMVVAGGAGVAALNVNRLVTVCLRSELPWAALKAYLSTLRVSAVFADFNAAGSYFALMVPLSLGLAFSARPFRGVWLFATGLTGAGLWLAGSRAAVAAVVPAAIAIAIALAGERRLRSVVAAVVFLLAVGGFFLLPTTVARFAPSDPTRSLGVTLHSRLELSRAALKMFADHPLAGVGVGGFRLYVGDYVSQDLPEEIRHENAHNNVLQMLAELGLTGFLPLVWLLVAVARQAWPALRSGALNGPLAGAVSGVAAFGLTCLSGHPLLIDVVAFAFWLVLGVVAGLGAETVRRQGGQRS